MYLTYDTKQHTFLDHLYGYLKQNKSFSPPRRLLRMSDMTLVAGDQAQGTGYCALSYPWIYSGEIITDVEGRKTCIDKAQHQIITYSPDAGEPIVTKATFTEFLRHLCKDLDITYLWYDQMCIDQSNNDEKLSEISEMRDRYRYANLTVALIPEMEINSNDKTSKDAFKQCLKHLQRSEWCKSMWTLQESIHSQTILFVGKNVRVSSDQLRLLNKAASGIPRALIDSVEAMYTFPESASALLRHAHSRTSSSKYDKVFALANIIAHYDHFKVEFDFTYKDSLQDKMVELYSILAKKDISVLCFGKRPPDYRSTVYIHDFLPSWTGVAGTHALSVLKTPSLVDCCDSIDENGCIYIECNYVVISPAMISTNDIIHQVPKTTSSFGVEITHYVKRISPIISSEEAIVLPTYLSLTEEALNQCFVLDIQFDTSDGFASPVLVKNGEMYRSIGICLFTLKEWNFKQLCNGVLDNFGTLDKAKFIIK